MHLKKEDLILFIGDSVTDAKRERSDLNDLGKGYPKMVAEILTQRYPELNLQFLNKGINGNKIIDLERRWQEDCLDFHPDVVSILIGINDTWHNIGKVAFGNKRHLRRFERKYRKILMQVKEKTNAQIVMMEPFVLSEPVDRLEWRVDLDPRIQVVRKLAAEFATDFIPLDGLLNAEGMKRSYSYLTGNDGVHPTQAGHKLIAKEWINRVEN
ncbi:Acetylxylan esterase [Jeotgalibaca dankookensis]|uniref:Acetylxylan esterase n=1 Tax=Jeotgalibaca dankookensis TaxID=708126 RepID=A0A1S6IS48_9LACT|nr:SGNH/GDSL hydrolase family protein [Jeotgalibaca dankookensis]AQS54375.1 Acetylxylan esterase [Jeotgalibaca dankookensis]